LLVADADADPDTDPDGDSNSNADGDTNAISEPDAEYAAECCGRCLQRERGHDA
jgi:hypothetical protein